MGGSSDSNSFIPKRGPANRSRRSGSRQVYLFTLISYVLFSATLIASVGVFLYERYVEGQLENEVVALNQAIDQFRASDLASVRDFNNRLSYASQRIAVATSLDTFFNALEIATAETAKIGDLSMRRQGDDSFLVEASIQTNTFDSSLLQREFLKSDSVFSSVLIDNIDITPASGEGSQNKGSDRVTFTALLDVPIYNVAYVPPTTPLTNSNLDEFDSLSDVVDETATSSELVDTVTATSSIDI